MSDTILDPFITLQPITHSGLASLLDIIEVCRKWGVKYHVMADAYNRLPAHLRPVGIVFSPQHVLGAWANIVAWIEEMIPQINTQGAAPEWAALHELGTKRMVYVAQIMLEIEP